ncbi:MAG: 4-(cytidine 5'-diphospho)-2-C-methyl-D-erythritol kinase [Spirochaetes bacterium]|nr:4-(cytidine 5'-diphospho)-2-C-methyl-D-erythritol kinase [Spirochaetota bacterium]
MGFSEVACAKVNLHLEILNRRNDGYHNIFSLMVSVDLFDLLQLEELEVFEANKTVDVEIIPRGGKFAWLMATVPHNENLIVKATKAYFAKIGKSGTVVVGVEKNIPAAAGLGGGSSDAAAMLRLMNSQIQPLDEKELLHLASTIGADVPYCLFAGSAICRGIGDEIERIEGRLPYWVLILYRHIPISTKEAYRALERTVGDGFVTDGYEEKANLIKRGVEKGDIGIFKHILKNDFEEYVFSKHPELMRLKEQLLNMGAEYAAMTGSGSAIYGVFKNYDLMRHAEQYFSTHDIAVYASQIV